MKSTPSIFTRSVLCAAVAASACGEPLAADRSEDTGSLLAGPDVSTPYPIDHLNNGPQTPGSYKGLPLQLAGNPEPSVQAVDGVIGVVCIGMSNSQQECSEWISRLTIEPMASEVSPQVRVVNCAVPSHALEQWIDPTQDPELWDACINTKLAQRGVRRDQVRVVYHKVAHLFGPTSPVFYPDPASDYFSFYDDLGAFAARVKPHFPNVQAVYTTSRSYGGFNTRLDRGEPLSYEQGHALNAWLHDHRSFDAVWYGWGPYIWAPDCATGITNRRGTCYVRADYQSDGIHPSPSGRRKIATMIHQRMMEHAWYRAAP